MAGLLLKSSVLIEPSCQFCQVGKRTPLTGTRVYGGYVLVGFTSKPTNATGRHHLVSLLL